MENKTGIRIQVVLKHMGNVTKKVKPHPFFLANVPHTFRELIEESVRSCISDYRKRAAGASDPEPLTEEQFESMREIGKFAFGVHYNENAVSEEKAIEAALEAVGDGIVRVFRDDRELTNFDEEIKVSEGDVFTFVKLTMLSGRMW